MPLYEYECVVCGRREERILPIGYIDGPRCCLQFMKRQYSGGQKVKAQHQLWMDRIDEIHKAQADKGERLRFVFPKEVGAT